MKIILKMDLLHIHKIHLLDGLAQVGHLAGAGHQQQYHGFYKIVMNIMNIQEIQLI